MSDIRREDVGTVASLIGPTDALWRLAAHDLLLAFARDLPGTPFTAMFPPSGAMFGRRSLCPEPVLDEASESRLDLHRSPR